MKQRLFDDMKTAMKSSNRVALDCLRMMISEIKKEEIDARKELGTDDVIRILKKGIKTREDSVAMFDKAGRTDLSSKEKEEIRILKTYLPAQLTAAQVEKIVTDIIAQVGATSKTQTGQVMKAVMSQHGGQVDGKTVQQIVASKLG